MGRVPFIPEVRIARAADELIRAHRVQNPVFSPPYSLDELIWDHLNQVDDLSLDDETPLGQHPETGEAILGKTVLEQRVIFIDPTVKTQPYFRFTLAHEIGHWILHCRPHMPDPNQLSLFGEAEEDYPKVFNTYHRAILAPSPGLDPEEIQANKFAACLLMPEVDMRRSFEERFGNPQTCGPGEIDAAARKLASERVRGFPSLRELFGTSIESTGYRLRDLSLVSEESPLFS
ncbi:ImmA/IrrE family metallo-endopeptidase [bacterium]|nr:ImmA/IrrE family metallo-endopeptidase [bacterium]